MTSLVLYRALVLCVTFVLALGGCRWDTDAEHARNWSQYVTLHGGARLAVDIWLPKRKQRQRLPAAVQMTRYHRAAANPGGERSKDSNYEEANRWTQAGYAFVIVDARGSGASFGERSGELSPQEIADYDQFISWIASQQWSNGRVGTYGTSYSGDTAELVARLRNPHLRATGLLFNDFDLYEDVVAPGGLLNVAFAQRWSLQNNVFDGLPGAIEALADFFGLPADELRPQLPIAKPVDGSDGERLRSAAIAEHVSNSRLLPQILSLEFRDQPFASGSTLDALSPFSYQRDIETSGVPMLVLASWMDAGSARGAIARFMTFSNTQDVHIGSWNHGGDVDADPFNPVDAPAQPSAEDQAGLLIRFFDRYMKDGERPDGSKHLRYYTLGERRWRDTDRWPLPDLSTRLLYFGPDHSLTESPPDSALAADSIDIDPTATTGPRNRWTGQATGDDVVYPERTTQDAKLLTYETEAFDRDTRVTGSPIVRLHLAAAHEDAALFVYLENVAPDGTVTYLTEGQLRLVNRAVDSSNPPYRSGRIPRSFRSTDAMPMSPGEVIEVAFDLLPTSALIAHGHRLRLAIAGADADTFVPVVDDQEPTAFVVHRSLPHPSHIEVPIAPVEESGAR